MKAEELMIGDWVYIKDHPTIAQPMQVKKEHFVRSLVEFEPIPITSEILEKNGWKEDGFYYRSEEFNGHIQLGKLFEHASIVTQDCRINLPPYRMKYVHEFQHALKMCGIEKEISV